MSAVFDAYDGSDPAASLAVCSKLERAGPLGRVAAELFRAQKASARAKCYRGGTGRKSYRALAYGRKESAVCRLSRALAADAAGLGWGWGRDEATKGAKWVLYIDLPGGQVSFHTPQRFDGPDYPGGWDGEGASEKRVIAFCEGVFAGVGG